MSKAEQTRQFIIEKASPVFNTKGYDSTSLADIQEVTGLTKGAIYGNFSDKNELAIAAYEYNCSLIKFRLKAVLEKAATAKEALLSFAGYYPKNWQEVFKIGGCPMLNAAVEADDHLHFMRDSVRKSMKRVIKSLQNIIEQGQASCEFKPSAHAEEYAALLFSILEGNILLAKIMNNPKYLQAAEQRITMIIESELVL